MKDKLPSRPRYRSLLVLPALFGSFTAGCASTGGGGVPDELPEGAALAPAAPAAAAAAEVVPAGPIQDRPDMEWWRESMKGREARVAWFKEARFGMFVHWGAYSHVGGIWEGKPVEGYAEHIMRKAKIPSAVYRDKLVAPFNPTEFNADEWIATLKRAGMEYFIITSKHHDGFAMYDSAVSDYNVVKASAWKHDPMKDLKEACKKHGVKFGFYYSQAWEWHHPDAPGNDWEYQNPGGDRRLFGLRWWETNPDLVPRVRRYVDGKVIPQLQELIAKYDPDILWFDTPGRLPPEENIKILKAVRTAKPSVVVNSRICQPVPGGPKANFGDYYTTTDKPAEFPPHEGEWEGIPTTNESYGWHKGDTSHKPPAHFIQLLAKAAARGGNILLNIGPMNTGKFEQKDVAILDEVGAWMKVNAVAVRGTERSPLPVQAWGESTRKGNTLYLHVLAWPDKGKSKGRVVVGGLATDVKRAYLLSQPKRALPVKRLGKLDLAIQGPARAPDAADTVIALELAGEPAVDPARLLSSDVAVDTLRAFDAQISGQLKFGDGKSRDAYVHGWTRLEDSVRWPVRLREPASFEVAIVYDAPKSSAGGTFTVKVGDQTFVGQVAETPGQPVVLGRVSLPAGSHELSVTGTKIQGEELLRLRGLTLSPVAGNVVSRAGR